MLLSAVAVSPVVTLRSLTFARPLALPHLPAEELQVVPTYEWMHHFDRSLLLTQLGGTSSSPSFYHVPEAERSLLPNRGYKDREAVHEHFDQTTQAPTALSSSR